MTIKAAPSPVRTEMLKTSVSPASTSSIGLYALKIETQFQPGLPARIFKDRNHRDDIGDNPAHGQSRSDRRWSPAHMVE